MLPTAVPVERGLLSPRGAPRGRSARKARARAPGPFACLVPAVP
jgi:hypothetical protein